MAPWSNGRRSLLLLALGGAHLARGIEQMAPIAGVTGSKYDARSGTADDDFKGCFDTGCKPELLIDGLLNDVLQSRWSCEIALVGSAEECYVTFDLGETLTLTKLVLYFRESNDTTRTPNDFIVSTSLTDVTYDEAFTGVNVLGTEIGVGEEFEFPALSSGRYVRLQGDLEVDEWMSVNEAIIYHEVDTTPAPTFGSSTILPAPTLGSSTFPPAPTPGTSTTPTASPTAEIYVDSDSIFPTGAPTPVAATSVPTAGGTFYGGEECMNVTLSGAGPLNGEFVTTVATSTATASSSGEVTFVSAADSATVMTQSEESATCSNSFKNCTANQWQIATNDVRSFVVYDDAAHPSLIKELWLSIADCASGTCQTDPADLSIVCGDGSASLAPTPAPVVSEPSVCGVVVVTGTSEAASIDGLYYADGTDTDTGVSQYNGYDVDGTSNGNTISAKSMDGACFSSSSTGASVAATASSDCAFRQWWVKPQESTGTETATSYFTYDEADHPADMEEGGLWYTSTDEMLPYDGEVVITCAPATTPTLSPDVTSGAPVETPTPSPGSRDVPTQVGQTRAPVPSLNETLSPAEVDVSGERSEGGGSGETAVIVGGVVGGVALLAILGAVAYKMKKATPPPPPPSYDDLVGA